MGSYTAPPIPVDRFRDMRRMDLVFGGVEQAGPSFEVRIFLNNPAANETTEQTPETGYAGSFHVYGYGELAPPAIAEARRERATGDKPVAPIEKRLHVDEGVLRPALEGSDELLVTAVPVPSGPDSPAPKRPFERVDAVFEPAATEP
jgi:hypothetical protein